MLRIVAVLVAFFLFLAASDAEAKRVALVIGNSAYEHAAPLANPRNDAVDMAAKLDELGFEVVRGLDLDFQEMRRTVRDFARSLEGAELALFFYAGHGLQVDGTNYMAPVNARLVSEIDLDFEAVPMDLVMSVMERSTDVNLVFLDACRDNPLARNLARSMGTRSGSVGRGLAKLGSGIGSLIAFATQPGNVALDGTGRNSPFTTALLEHLGTPGQDVTRDLIHVRRSVLEATDGKQVPWDNSSLTGEVILKKREAAPAPPAEPDAPSQFELSFWDSIKNANSKSYFETYLAQFPEGKFSVLARLKIEEIERVEAEAKARAQEQELAREQAKSAQRLQAQIEAERKAREESEAARLAEQKKLAAEREATLRDAVKARKAAEEARIAVEKRLAELAEATRQAEQKTKPVNAQVQTGEADKEVEVAALQQPETEPEEPEIDPKDNRELVRAIQQQLNRIGCSAGRPDGIWGRNTDRGLASFGKHAKIASLEPSQDLLETLKSKNARVCPLVCSGNQEEKNGRCVTIKTNAPAKREASIPQGAVSQPKPSGNTRQGTPSASSSSGRSCWDCRFGGKRERVCGFPTDGHVARWLSGARCKKL